MERRKRLGAILLDRLSAAELQLVRGEIPATEPSDYDAALARVTERLSVLEDQVSRNREQVRDRYTELEEQPVDRRRMLFENSPPSLLLALAYGLMKQSYAARFEDVQRSLQLAELAVEAATAVKRTGFLAPGVAADLEAEALVYLGNARRINSDLTGSEEALTRAGECRTTGSHDRTLHAEWLRHLAMLRNDQSRAQEAGCLMDSEIALRRLIGDDEKLGEALINRGIVSVWFEPLSKACMFLKEGVLLAKNPKSQALALFPLGEALARKGKGLQAWKVCCQIDSALILAKAEELRVWNRALKGITFRVLGELADAERELRAAREEFFRKGHEVQAAIASLELACVYAAQRRFEEVKTLAKQALAIVTRERLGKEALRAVLTLQQAAEAERVTEQLAVEVVNFIVRSRLDRSLRFEWRQT